LHAHTTLIEAYPLAAQKRGLTFPPETAHIPNAAGKITLPGAVGRYAGRR